MNPKQRLDELLVAAAGNPSGRRGRTFREGALDEHEIAKRELPGHFRRMRVKHDLSQGIVARDRARYGDRVVLQQLTRFGTRDG